MRLLSFSMRSSSSAFERSLLECHDSLYRYARALYGDVVRAEDAVQETYVRALKAPGRPKECDIRSVRRWSFVILRNIWKNEKRRQGREEPTEFFEQDLRDDGIDPESAVVAKELREAIESALDQLSEPLREAVLLRDVEGLSYAEMAEVLDCPPGTVMSRLARARGRLREMLGPEMARRQRSSVLR